MPRFNDVPHIKIEGRTEILPYTSPMTGRSKLTARTGIDRTQHGNNIKKQFNQAVEDFNAVEENEFVYLVFKSPLDFLLDLDKLDKNQCRLASYKSIETLADDQIHKMYEAAVYLNKQAISKFLTKIQ